MSGFYGELLLHGTRSRADVFRAMDAAMAGWGPDGAAQWQEGPLTVAARLLRVTVDDATAAALVVESDLVVVGHVRIDNRAVLGASLGLRPLEVAAMADTQLLARAWRRWRDRWVELVVGDWVCAIWDRQRESLWLGRDASGNTGLYYWSDAARLVFATSLPALLAHPAVPRRVNSYQIAQQLAFVWDPAQSDQTAYRGVERLPGGHALRCDHGRVERYGWWFPESLPELVWPGDGDYYEAFRELYTTVVTEQVTRTDGPVALMLSSGLDSGTVAALAAPSLAARGRRLLAFTSVPRFAADAAAATHFGDEGDLAEAIARYVGNIEFQRVAAEHSTILGSIETMLDLTGEPVTGPSNAHWILEILQRARAGGVRLLLTGRGGNATVSWAGTGDLMPALRQGDWRSLLAASRQSELGGWLTLKQQVLRPAIASLKDRVAPLRRLRRPEPPPPAALNPRLAASLDFYRRARESRDEFFRGSRAQATDRRITQFRLGRRDAVTQGPLWMALGAAHQLEIRDPTVDRRLIEFCWRVPDRIFWAGGRQRGLIRAGMADSLPRAVMQSERRGQQGADVGHRILAERESMIALLGRLATNPLANECLDIPAMRSALHSLEQGVTQTTSELAIGVLLRGLNVGLLLTRF